MLSHEDVRELLIYCPETGSLIWKARGASWFSRFAEQHWWNYRFAGKEAGSEITKSDGYKVRTISVFNKTYLAHKVIWFWMTGGWPEEEIDHGNRCALDNRWKNLRLSGIADNNRNKSMYANNTSGVSGVSWAKDRGMWRAGVRMGGKRVNLGCFHKDDLDLAAMEVMEFRAESGFTDGHGKVPGVKLEETP